MKIECFIEIIPYISKFTWRQSISLK